MKKSQIITWMIIIGVVALAFFIMNRPTPETPKEITQCIGKNSVLYVQLGCHACEYQKEVFGDNYNELKIVDCFYERDKCTKIKVTPTWKINEELIEGVQEISTLQSLTGCN